MDGEENKKHWESWAKEFQHNLRATTKGKTIKEIEIYNLISAIEKFAPKKDCNVLECGCGNGFNIIEVSKKFPSFKCLGFDFVQTMIESAQINKEETEERLGKRLPLKFVFGDLREPEKVGEKFDIIFTNRAIINLSSPDEQKESLSKIAKMLTPEGVLILLENSVSSLREKFELEKRNPAKFNVFINEKDIIRALEEDGLKLELLKNVGSLHDILLYVLLPKITGNTDNYDNPLVDLAKKLEMSFTNNWEENQFGSFGQMNLFVFRKK
jgi:ubiquinone/menaquinone biosynthesis C-methylase UbiE